MRYSRPGARLPALCLIAALLCMACSEPVTGQPSPGSLPSTSAADSLAQSVVDLGEAAAVRYRGVLTTASGSPVTLNVTVTQGGEVTGTMTAHGRQADVLVLNKTLYLKADKDFWTAMPGIPNSTAPAITNRWAKIPGVVLGVELGELLTPSSAGTGIGTTANKRPLAEGPAEVGRRHRHDQD